jgi:hypothetical protein
MLPQSITAMDPHNPSGSSFVNSSITPIYLPPPYQDAMPCHAISPHAPLRPHTMLHPLPQLLELPINSRVGYLPANTCSSALQLHPSGRLLAQAQQGGLMHICRADEVLGMAQQQAPQAVQQQQQQQAAAGMLPTFAMPRHGHHFHTDIKLSSVRWSPGHDSMLGYCGVSRCEDWQQAQRCDHMSCL